MGVLKKVTGDVGCKMGGCKIGVKGPKSCFSENGQKKMEKNEKDPNFLLKRKKTIFYPTHPVRKNEKNAMG